LFLHRRKAEITDVHRKVSRTAFHIFMFQVWNGPYYHIKYLIILFINNFNNWLHRLTYILASWLLITFTVNLKLDVLTSWYIFEIYYQVHMYVDSREKVTARYQVTTVMNYSFNNLDVSWYFIILVNDSGLFCLARSVDLPIQERNVGVWKL
jgi:hypothetical protein